MVQMKSAYPKVSLNLLGNLHQMKVIHVPVDDDENNESGAADQQKNGADGDSGMMMQESAANEETEIDIAAGGPAR